MHAHCVCQIRENGWLQFDAHDFSHESVMSCACMWWYLVHVGLAYVFLCLSLSEQHIYPLGSPHWTTQFDRFPRDERSASSCPERTPKEYHLGTRQTVHGRVTGFSPLNEGQR